MDESPGARKFFLTGVSWALPFFTGVLRTAVGRAAAGSAIVGVGMGTVVCCCILGGVSAMEELNCGCAIGIRRDETGVEGANSVGWVEDGQLRTRKRVLDV